MTIGIATALAKASNILTSTGTIPTANDTVTIGSVVYTFVATAAATANEVDLGATAAAALTNLKAAINADPAGSGTLYGSATVAHPQVEATTLTATTLKVVSKVAGTIGNGIRCLATSTQLDDWTAAVMAGGTGSLPTEIAALISQGQLNSEAEQFLRELTSDVS